MPFLTLHGASVSSMLATYAYRVHILEQVEYSTIGMRAHFGGCGAAAAGVAAAAAPVLPTCRPGCISMHR